MKRMARKKCVGSSHPCKHGEVRGEDLSASWDILHGKFPEGLTVYPPSRGLSFVPPSVSFVLPTIIKESCTRSLHCCCCCRLIRLLLCQSSNLMPISTQFLLFSLYSTPCTPKRCFGILNWDELVLACALFCAKFDLGKTHGISDNQTSNNFNVSDWLKRKHLTTTS